MRVAYIGREPDLGWAAALAGHQLAAVARLRPQLAVRKLPRQVARRLLRGRDPLEDLAHATGARCLTTASVAEPSFLRQLEAAQPDLVLCCGWPQRFPDRLLQLPRLGCVNAHPSLLPAHRGPDPCAWTLLRGEEVSGLTFHRMTERMDGGELLAQVRVPVLLQDDAGSLLRRCLAAGAARLPALLDSLERSEAVGRPQDEAKATQDGPLPEAMKIDFTLPSRTLHDRIRARLPRPGVRAKIEGQRYRVLGSLPLEDRRSAQPGKVLSRAGRRLCVATGEGSLVLTVAAED